MSSDLEDARWRRPGMEQLERDAADPTHAIRFDGPIAALDAEIVHHQEQITYHQDRIDELKAAITKLKGHHYA